MLSAFLAPFEHPIKREIRRRRIRLWMLRDYTGVNESKLSRYLNHREPMPFWLEQGIRKYLELWDANRL